MRPRFGTFVALFIAFLAPETNRLLAAPPNDDFDQARKLVGMRVVTRGTTVGAATEFSEPSAYGNTVWFKWTAPATRLFHCAASSRHDNVYVSLHRGSGLQTLYPVTDVAPACLVQAMAGFTYYVQVSGSPNSDSAFTLRIRAVTPPPNDDITNAISFAGTNSPVEGTVRFSTMDSGGPIYALGEGNVWYRWEAPNDGLFFATIDDNSIYPIVDQGTIGFPFTHPGQTVLGLKRGYSFYATNAGIYWISVNGQAALASDFSLSISAETPPPNDHFTNSTIVNGAEVSTNGTSLGATHGSGEPTLGFPSPGPGPRPRPPLPNPGPVLPPTRRAASLISAASPGFVWFSWTAPTAGVYRISAKLITPPSDSVLGTPLSPGELLYVFFGSSLSLTQLTSGFPEKGALLTAAAGNTYHVAVPGGKFSFQFEIHPVQLPPNDDYTNAIALAGAVVAETGTTLNATPEPSNEYSDEAVWYRWTAPSNGFFAITVGSGHRINVYQGDDFPSAQVLHVNDPRTILHAVAGEEYHIGVAGSVLSNTFVLNIDPVTPPANDDFANSEPLVGTNIQFVAQLSNATAEDYEPGTAFIAGSDTVWFTWTAPLDGQFALSFPANLALARVFTGTNLLALAPISGNSEGWRLRDAAYFTARAGTTYHFSINDSQGHVADVPVELQFLPAPANDNFANGLPLHGARATVQGTLSGATVEAGETNPVVGVAQSVWYAWTARRDGRLSVEVDSSLIMIAFRGGPPHGLNFLAIGPQLDLPVNAGEPYHFAVIGDDTKEPASFELKLRFIEAPLNDDFSARTRFLRTARGTVAGASRESGEPGYDSDPNGFSVWWTWRAPHDVVFEFELLGSASMDVFTGESLDALAPVELVRSVNTIRFLATRGSFYQFQIFSPTNSGSYRIKMVRRRVPSNDDFINRAELVDGRGAGTNRGATGEPGEWGAEDPLFNSIWWRFTALNNGWHTLAARVTNSLGEVLPLNAAFRIGDSLTNLEAVWWSVDHLPLRYFLTVGTDYSIQVVAPEGHVGDVGIEVHHVPSPANDHFTNAAPITGEHALIEGSNTWATLEPGEPPNLNMPGHNTVWWRFTPQAGDTYLLTLNGSAGNLSVFTGEALSQLTLVPFVSYGAPWPSAYLFRPRTSVEHFIRMASVGADEGEFTLGLDRVKSPPNDDFTNRTELVGSQVVANGTNVFATPEPGDPLITQLSEQTVWWRWTAPTSGQATLDFMSPRYIHGGVFRGETLTNLTTVAPPGGLWPKSFPVEQGVEYSIGATTFSQYATNFTLILNAPAPAGP